jgi:hypothetical protein
MRRSCIALSWASENDAVGDVACGGRYNMARPTPATDATSLNGVPTLIIRCAARIFAVVVTVGRLPVRPHARAAVPTVGTSEARRGKSLGPFYKT